MSPPPFPHLPPPPSRPPPPPAQAPLTAGITAPIIVPFPFLPFFAGYAYNKDHLSFIVLMSLSGAWFLALLVWMIKINRWLLGWDLYVGHLKAADEGRVFTNGPRPAISDPFAFHDRAHISPDPADYQNPAVHQQMADQYKPRTWNGPARPGGLDGPADYAVPMYVPTPVDRYVPALDRYMPYI